MGQVLTITDTALSRIRAIRSSDDTRALRLSTVSSGCAGHKYDFSFADAPKPGDEKVDVDGQTIYVDMLSLMNVLGTRIDWVEEGFEKKFVFDNPNQTSACGCGQSVSFQ